MRRYRRVRVVYSPRFLSRFAGRLQCFLPGAHGRGKRMESESRNLQNDFFNAARKEKTVLTIFLSNGKKLVGRLKSFDKFTLLLDSHHGDQIIFKHAISTVSHASARPPQRGSDRGADRPSERPASQSEKAEE